MNIKFNPACNKSTKIHKLLNSYLSLKIVKYAIVGIISTLIHIVLAFLFIYFISPSLLFSNIFGFSIAYIFSYIAQSTIVFDSELSVKKAIKYFIVQFSSLIISIQITNIIDEINVYLSVLLVVIIMPIITFVIHKLWTFSEID
jgi:putative flippase GtrA